MLDPETSIATIVLDHTECAAVFERHRIDYCDGGQRRLGDACRARNLDPAAVLDELEAAIRRRAGAAIGVDPRELSTRALITEVIGAHHRDLHHTLPFLRTLANRVGREHGLREPRLQQVAVLTYTLVETLLDHLREEDHVVFPALLAGEVEDVTALAAMQRAHDEIGTLLAALRDAAAGFAVPDWACTSHRTLMRELAILEADTLRHIHVENDVLASRFAHPALSSAASSRPGAER
jgi:regulator of cell morphogenesis and NO signaling